MPKSRVRKRSSRRTPRPRSNTRPTAERQTRARLEDAVRRVEERVAYQAALCALGVSDERIQAVMSYRVTPLAEDENLRDAFAGLQDHEAWAASLLLCRIRASGMMQAPPTGGELRQLLAAGAYLRSADEAARETTFALAESWSGTWRDLVNTADRLLGAPPTRRGSAPTGHASTS